MQQCGIRSRALTASFTGKTAYLDGISLFPGLLGAWVSLRYSWFVVFLLVNLGCN